MATILITGAGGFIAPHIIRHLHQRPDNRLVAVTRQPVRLGRADRVEYAAADLTDPIQPLELVKRCQPDAVIHAAGLRSPAEPGGWRGEAEMARAIMDAVTRAAPAAHILLLGSAAEYGLMTDETPICETAECRPVTDYGRAKLALTEDALTRAQRGDLNVTILRPFNAIGTGIRKSLAAGAFLEQIRNPRRQGDAYFVKMGPRHHVRDFFDAIDLGRTIERVLSRRITGEIINVCTGQGRTLDSLLQRIATLAGARLEFEVDPGTRTAEPRSYSVGDCSKSLRLLDFAPSENLDATLLAMWREAVAGRADGVPAALATRDDRMPGLATPYQPEDTP